MDQQEVLEQQNEATQETAQEAQPVQSEQTATNEHEPETMQEVLDQYGDNVHLRRGEIKTGTVISKSENGFLVDIGFKCEGVLPMKEYTNHSLIETEPEPKPGDQIDVEVVSVRDGDDAQLLLSRWRHEFDKRWAKLDALAAENHFPLGK